MKLWAVCVACKHREDISADAERLNESHDVPMCSKCYSPMVVEEAESE